jgi:glutaminase
MIDYQLVLDEIALEVTPAFGKGTVASYIPALAAVPPRSFGMAVRTITGEEFTVGLADAAFSIQSISKVFTLMLALARTGDEVWTRVGKEPSGNRFNSLVQLEYEKGVPRNPFINAGALAVLDLLMANSRSPDAVILGYARMLSGNADIAVDPVVATSEIEHADINRALAYFMRGHGIITGDVTRLMEIYCGQCALAMSCRDLARAFLPLAEGGYSDIAGESILTEGQAKRINALMLTCGLYDNVGNFAYRVGLPAKSGVGGGIVAVVPGKLSVAVWAPELDRSGNSYVGTRALELFTRLTRLSIF